MVHLSILREATLVPSLKPDYSKLTDEKLIEEAAKRLDLPSAWSMLAKVCMTRPESRESMRGKIIKNLNLLDEYKIQ
jgi:hypothetical protein